MHSTNPKYLYLPNQFWSKHDLCFSLVSQIEEFVIDKQYNKLRYMSIPLTEHDLLPTDNENLYEYLLRTNRKEEHDMFVYANIVNALLMDTCYFLQEALDCSLKMRLSVTYALLRKPFVYNLLVFLQLLYDDEFLDKFINNESFDSTKVSNEDKKNLIRLSLKNSVSLKEENVDDIYDVIFNKKNHDSIINYSEKALHLSTTRNDYKTEKMNLNFVFSTYNNNLSLWEYLYSKLPLLLLYLNDVLDSLVIPFVGIDDDSFHKRLLKRIDIFKNDVH